MDRLLPSIGPMIGLSVSVRMANMNYVCTVASLLSCLHQLRTENVRLEEHVGNLLQRRDHLLAVNARLAIPLTTGTCIGCYERKS